MIPGMKKRRRKMKKFISAALAATLCLSMAACSSSQPAETTAAATEAAAEETKAEEAAAETKAAAEAEKSDKPIRVCIVYTGNLGDKSYNDSCNMGAQKAVEDFGIELKSLEGGTADEWKANLLAACEEGYDLIIGASSNIADYITEYGPSYPDTKFAVIDTTVDLPNVPSWPALLLQCSPRRPTSKASTKTTSSDGSAAWTSRFFMTSTPAMSRVQSTSIRISRSCSPSQVSGRTR